jgi:hypothetical protein
MNVQLNSVSVTNRSRLEFLPQEQQTVELSQTIVIKDTLVASHPLILIMLICDT